MTLLELRTAINAMLNSDPNTGNAPVVIDVSGEAGIAVIDSIAILDTEDARKVECVFTPIPA